MNKYICWSKLERYGETEWLEERERTIYEDASTAVWLPLGAIIKNVKWLCAQMFFVSLCRALSLSPSVSLPVYRIVLTLSPHSLHVVAWHFACVLFVGLIKTPTHINNYNLICFNFSLLTLDYDLAWWKAEGNGQTPGNGTESTRKIYTKKIHSTCALTAC